MRSRSTSVYAKRPPVSQSGATPQDSTAAPTEQKSRSYTVQQKIDLFEDFGPMSLNEDKDKFMGDFKFKEVKHSPKHNDDSYSLSRDNSTMLGSYDCDYMRELIESDAEEKSLSKVLRAMVIGAKNVGKRSLLRAVLPELLEDQNPSAKQQFDLISKTINKPNHSERYNFWLKEVDTNQKLSQDLFSSYYKTSSVFFLVYDVENKSSFFRLDEELCFIQETCKEKDPTIILIGNKRGNNCKKAVDFQEVALLKEKYSIGLFMEVDILNETPNELRLIIEYCLKDSH